MQVSRHPKIPEGLYPSSPLACVQWVVMHEGPNNAHSQRGLRRVQLPCFRYLLGPALAFLKVVLGNVAWS
jgi:hypothetical protein